MLLSIDELRLVREFLKLTKEEIREWYNYNGNFEVSAMTDLLTRFGKQVAIQNILLRDPEITSINLANTLLQKYRL